MDRLYRLLRCSGGIVELAAEAGSGMLSVSYRWLSDPSKINIYTNPATMAGANEVVAALIAISSRINPLPVAVISVLACAGTVSDVSALPSNAAPTRGVEPKAGSVATSLSYFHINYIHLFLAYTRAE
jgi:hypothetical protein